MNGHVIGYGWTDEHPYLRLNTSDAQVRYPLADYFALKLGPHRHCIGWYDGESHQPCPDTVEGSGPQCAACIQRERFNPCIRCDGLRCPPLPPDILAYCHQTHYLYLACFGDETIKIGTASEPRKHQRLVEQGPLAAAYIAQAIGPTIKQMEKAVSALGYTEMMRRTTKLRLLTSGMDVGTAQALVLDAFGRIADRMGGLYAQPEWFIPPELAVRARQFDQMDIINLRAGDVVKGPLVGASGSVLVIDDRGMPSAVELADLPGWDVEMNPAEAPTNPRQMRLF